MNIRKVVLIENEGPKRDEHQEFLESMGYEVAVYRDAEAALKDIVHSDPEHSVIAGPFAMGSVYTADEVKKCLDIHGQNTGIQYAVISFDVPERQLPIDALKNAKVPYIHGSGAEDIARLVGREFRKVEFQAEAEKRIEELFGGL
jgi:hypothetical protein